MKLLVILGPTATGKSDIAVKLAKEFNGEVISADSRQVYRGLDVGAGKIKPEEMERIPHHLLDVADPDKRFTAMAWKNLAEQAIFEINSRGKLPIICGGTGFYISTLIDNLGFPDVKADTEEQKMLESKTAEELFEELKKLDPRRAATIDLKNKRRLARAIIIARELGSVPTLNSPVSNRYDPLLIGITLPDAELKERIKNRLVRRIENEGMIEEAERLHKEGLSFERMDEFGLEYRYLAQCLQGKLNKDQLIEILSTKIWQYARRQKTWFKRDKRIKWFTPSEFDAIATSVRENIFRDP